MKRVFNLALIFGFTIFISLTSTEVLASHSVDSSPVGGTYNSAQLVSLSSTDPSSQIYYTIDGTEPTNSSNLYSGVPINIDSNVTLKFMAIDTVDNHTSSTVSETFLIDMSPPIVSATPTGGAYGSPQTVTLQANEPATIYYTTNGTNPTNSSIVYSGPIDVDSSTTLKFLAIDAAGNPSTIHSEVFQIGGPIILTEPADGATRVNSRAIINVTFGVPMDESTINDQTFIVTDETNDVSAFGEVSYDSGTNTASFRLFNPNLTFQGGHPYKVTLTTDITDDTGNPLPEDYEFTFTPWFSIVIRLFDNPFSSNFLGGSEFTITPNPLTSSGSLAVKDNGPNDADSDDGQIEILDVERGTYVLSQTIVPDGFASFYDNVIYTVHETNPDGPKDIEDRDLLIPTTDFLATIPAPDLSEEQFNLFNGNATRGFFSGIQDEGQTSIDPIDSVSYIELSPSILASPTQFSTLDPHLDSILFSTKAQVSLSGAQLFDAFKIPTYPAVAEDLSTQTIYVPSAFVIPYDDSKNNFVLTPVIAKVYPGQTLFMAQPSFVESTLAKFETVNMTFAVEGNNIGFSFGITDTRPPGTPDPGLVAPALFMDVGFVGDVDFSDSDSFQSAPRVDILVDKAIPGFDELPDGCSDFVMLLFNEDQNKWVEVQKLRTPILDSGAETPDDPSDDRCGFALFPEHFSKFAVGGVKGQTISTEESTEVNEHHGGGGRSRSTAVTQTPTGSDVETSINTKLGEVIVQFENVESGSGQLRIEANELSVFEKYFDDMAFLQDDTEHGIIQLDGKTYATTGDVFDIDASSVQFTGKVDVTIPYDAEIANSFGSESEMRFLHYNDELGRWEDVTKSVDENVNTVTGTLDSLSPVSAAIILKGGSETGTPQVGKIPSQFDIGLPEVSISQSEVLVTTELSNPSTTNQDYILIIQVLDSQGIVQQINWQTGSLPATKSGSISMALTSLDAGDYTMQVVVVSDLGNPWLLSYSKTKLAI